MLVLPFCVTLLQLTRLLSVVSFPWMPGEMVSSVWSGSLEAPGEKLQQAVPSIMFLGILEASDGREGIAQDDYILVS